MSELPDEEDEIYLHLNLMSLVRDILYNENGSNSKYFKMKVNLLGCVHDYYIAIGKCPIPILSKIIWLKQKIVVLPQHANPITAAITAINDALPYVLPLQNYSHKNED